MNRIRRARIKLWSRQHWWAVFVVAAAIVPFVAFGVDRLDADAQTRQQESALWFGRMASVMFTDRCLNCHTVEDFPGQGDDHHRHANNVVRPASQRDDNSFGRGADAVPCFTCHASSNQGDGRQPGAPNWRMPPPDMGWDRITTAAELCHHILNPEFNGGRTPEQLVEHMTTDPLVQYAFDPGVGRKKPPLSQTDFHQAVRNWVATGHVCPDEVLPQ